MNKELEKKSEQKSFNKSENIEDLDGQKSTKPNSGKLKLSSTFQEFFLALYTDGKLTKQAKSNFSKFDTNLTNDEIVTLVNIATEKDKDVKITLTLAEMVLEGGEHSRNHEFALGLIEKIVSNYASLARVRTTTIFQSWLDASDGASDKLGFFSGQIDQLTTISVENEEGKPLQDSQKNNLLCIAAIWLYRKRKAGFGELIRYLSRTAFTVNGESGSQVESRAFGFAASMITSTKKAKFAYFLSQISSNELKFRQQLSMSQSELENVMRRLDISSKKNESLNQELLEIRKEMSEESMRNHILKEELERSRQHVKHSEIQHNDSKDDLRVKVVRLLDEDLRGYLSKAETANLRSKADIVEYMLKAALETIDREVSWLKQ